MCMSVAAEFKNTLNLMYLFNTFSIFTYTCTDCNVLFFEVNTCLLLVCPVFIL